MRLANPELQRLLAGRYVIGTMRGPARRRFESYLGFQPSLRQAVESWEQQLQPLADVLPPESPGAQVWQGLQDRIWGVRPRDASAVGNPWWRGFAYALVALVALGVGWQLNTPDVKPPPLHLAVLNTNQGVAGYMICTDARTGRTAIEVIQAGARQAQTDHELWLLPSDDSAPRSVGLMPATGRLVIDFPETLSPLLQTAKGLAVSQEPPGGSPLAGPSGPILYTGAVRKLWFPEKSEIKTASNGATFAYGTTERDQQGGLIKNPASSLSDEERLLEMLALLRP